MKSMISNKTKNDQGRVSISFSESEALKLFEKMKEAGFTKGAFYSHLGQCIQKLNELPGYASERVKD